MGKNAHQQVGKPEDSWKRMNATVLRVLGGLTAIGVIVSLTYGAFQVRGDDDRGRDRDDERETLRSDYGVICRIRICRRVWACQT